MIRTLVSSIIALTITACGEFNYSPYVSNVKRENLNGDGLGDINSRSSIFSNSFKVAVISDSHDYYKDLAKQVDYINKNKSTIAFVIHTGDATNLGLKPEWDLFRDKIKELDIPLVMAIGNHDLLSNGREIFEKRYGKKLNLSFTFKQTKFILINNNNWESPGMVPDLSWLEKELIASTEDNKVVLGHVQPDDTDRYSTKMISDTKSIINAYGVDLFINGHNHNPNEGMFGNAKRLTAGSSFKGKLLVLDISDAFGVQFEFVKM